MMDQVAASVAMDRNYGSGDFRVSRSMTANNLVNSQKMWGSIIEYVSQQ